MTRLLGLEEVDAKLRAAITNVLRVSDEATALPSASRSVESGAFKNVVMRLSGTEPDLNPELFSANWFAGASVVAVPAAVAATWAESVKWGAARAATPRVDVRALPRGPDCLMTRGGGPRLPAAADICTHGTRLCPGSLGSWQSLGRRGTR